MIERRRAAARIAELDARPPADPTSDDETAALLNILPITSQDLTQLPEEIQRQLYDAFHLQIRYHYAERRITIRITVSAATVHTLADSVAAATGATRAGPQGPGACADLVSTPGGTPTRTRPASGDRRPIPDAHLRPRMGVT
jgi:acetylornithine deacetylase/succinyl-diaminopimelate desuccinylase-like protein